MELMELDRLAKAHAEAHAVLADGLGMLERSLLAVKRELLPSIRRSLARAAETKARLHAGIEGSRSLFVSPRTLVLWGLKVGYAKGRGGLEIRDAGRTVELIKGLFGAEAGGYLHVTEKPDKEALGKLTAGELKRLGVGIVEASDEVVIRRVDGELEKVVEKLLGEVMAEEDRG